MERWTHPYAKVGVVLACFSAALSLLALYPDVPYAFIRVVVFTSTAIFLVLLWMKSGNLLFLARTFILGLIGYFPVLTKVIRGPEILFSPYEVVSQGMATVVVMYAATSLALLGNEIGLLLAQPRRPTPAPHLSPRAAGLWTTTFFVCVVGAVVATWLVMRTNVNTVLTAGYGAESAAGVEGGGEALPLGVVPAIGTMCLLAMMVAIVRVGKRYWWYIFIGCAFALLIIATLLRGARQDVLTPLFGMVVCYGLARRRPVRLTRKIFFGVGIAVVLFEAWGLVRSSLASESVQVLPLLETILWGRFSGDVIAFGTVSPISTTFANIVWLVDNGKVDLALGRSYWEFILRTPPEFLFPERPKDYAWIFEEFGLLAGGGFFELGEAYMNFGLLGAFAAPAVLSYLMGKAFYNVLAKQTVLSYFLLFSFLAVFLRGTWYQIFAFYKVFLTAMVLYACLVTIHELLMGATRGTRVSSVRGLAAAG